MEINTDYNLVKKTLENIDKIVSLIDLSINGCDYEQILFNLSLNHKITKDVIDFYNLDKIKYFKLENNPNFEINWLKEYPNKQLDFYILSERPNFSINWIKEYPNKNWNFNTISYNPNFSIEWIKEYPNKNWNINVLSYNPNFSIEWIKEYPDKNWNFDILSQHLNFSFDWVKEYPDKNWNFKLLSQNPNFSFDWVKEYPDKNWNFELLSQNSNFSFDWIEEYPDKNWNFPSLINREKFTTEYIELYPDKNWGKIMDFYKNNYTITNSNLKEFIRKTSNNFNYKIAYYYLSKHKNFNIDWLIHFPYKSRDINCLKNDPNFKFEWIENSLTQKWDFYNLQLHRKFNFNWVLKLPNLQWKYNFLHLHKNFKFEWIKKLPDKDWDFYNIKPELIDINFVKKYPHKNWNILNIIEHPKFTEDIINKTNNKINKLNYEVYFNKYFNPKWFEEHRNISWNYNKIEETHNFDVQWVLKYYNSNWSYIYDKNNYKKSYNKEELINESYYTLLNFDKDFDIEWINKYPEKKWNYDIICLHPNFKIEWLETISKTINNNFKISYLIDLIIRNKNFKLGWLSINLKYKESWNYNYIIDIIRTEEQLYNFLKFANNHIHTTYNLHYKNMINPKLITIEMLLEFCALNWNYDILFKN